MNRGRKELDKVRRLIRENWEEKTDTELSGMTGMSIAGIRQQRYRMKLHRPMGNPRNKQGLLPRMVARDVIAKLQSGERLIMKDILKARGYSEAVQTKPKNVTDTLAYQDEMQKYEERLTKHRDKILEAMDKVDLDGEEYRVLVDAQTKATHDIQLLTGGKTENVQIDEDRKTIVAILAEIRNVPKLEDESTQRDS